MSDKLYYKVSEVSVITGVPTYVLRFWETEFRWIRPKRTQTGRRLYTKRDIDLILKVKNLLYDKKFTIQGAKQYLKLESSKKKDKTPAVSLDEIRSRSVNFGGAGCDLSIRCMA